MLLPILSSKETETIKKRLLERADTDYTKQQKTVDEIIKSVREKKDEALFSYIARFDGYPANAQNLL